MSEKLIRCFYDGMSKEAAVRFLEGTCGKKVAKVSIDTAVKNIKKYTGKDW